MIWTHELFFIIDLSTFGLKSAFDPENYGFWNVPLTKKCSCLCDRKHECII
jgi:hypothetical protein